MIIRHEWDLCSVSDVRGRIDFAGEYQDESLVESHGARERRESSRSHLERRVGEITVETMFRILRDHGANYHPAEVDKQVDICVHAGPFENRLWQATGAMVSHTDEDGIVSWWTGTSGTCLSIFKPIFPGVDLPDMGPWPNDHYDDRSLFWKHELLHRHAILEFDALLPQIRNDFEALEAQFLADVGHVKRGTMREKRDFMEYCFRAAEEATERWLRELAGRSWAYPATPFGELWAAYNRASAFPFGQIPMSATCGPVDRVG